MSDTPTSPSEFEGIFEPGHGERPVMSNPPAVEASKAFIAEVAEALGLDAEAAPAAADWIANKMERFGARTAQPIFTVDGTGPACSWCGQIWPLCGHHHMSEVPSVTAADASEEDTK